MRSDCAECESCPHGKLRRNCAVYNPCPHGNVECNFVVCKLASAAPPGSKRVKRKPEISPKIKQESDIKLELKIKQEPFTIQRYFGFDK